jgi:hypothetical protein
MSENKTRQLQLVKTEVGNEPRPHRRVRAYLSVFVGGIALSGASFFAGVLWQRGAGLPPVDEGDHSEQITIATPILDAIFQNTPGQSEGYAVGIPKDYVWCIGSLKPAANSSPPSDFTAVTGKGQVYPKEGARLYSNREGITIKNAKTYVHLSTTREWLLVQDQATDEITGAHFVADFSPKAVKPMRLNAQPDRSVIIGAPPAGYNDHFWLAKRGTYAAGSVDGVYVQMDMRTNDPNMKFVANVGADWWLDASTRVVGNLPTISGAGQSNWVELSTRWSTLRFYYWNDAQLQADPPPPLTDSLLETTPTIKRRRANTLSPCRSAS